MKKADRIQMLEELIAAEPEVTDFFRHLLDRAHQNLPIDSSFLQMLRAMKKEASNYLEKLEAADDECHICGDTRPLIVGPSGYFTCPGCGEV